MYEHDAALEALRSFLKSLPGGSGEFPRADRKIAIAWINDRIADELVHGAGTVAEQLDFFRLLWTRARHSGARSLVKYTLVEWAKRTTNLYGAIYGAGFWDGHKTGNHFSVKRASKSLAERRTRLARRAANALHNKPGGSREKVRRIRAAWASGRFSNRDVCAEQECAGLGMSFSAARRALRKQPSPKR